MTAQDLARALAAAGITAPADWQEVTGSTNATALAMARRGAPEWSIAAAAHQTAGRGRMGRVWEDVPGAALMCSIVLRPALRAAEAGLLTLLAGAAMAEAAEEASGLEVRCTWPNDLVVAGAKVGGILAESGIEGAALSYVAMGVGVNLEAPGGVEDATALGPSVDAMDLLTRFLLAFRRAYRPGDPGFPDDVVRAWTARSATLGRTVEALGVDGTRIAGEAVGVDRRGALVVRTPQGERSVSSGEIEHLPRPRP